MTNVIVPESNHHRCTTAGMTEFKIDISQQKIPTIVVLDVLIEPDSKTVVRFFFEEQGTWFVNDQYTPSNNVKQQALS